MDVPAIKRLTLGLTCDRINTAGDERPDLLRGPGGNPPSRGSAPSGGGGAAPTLWYPIASVGRLNELLIRESGGDGPRLMRELGAGALASLRQGGGSRLFLDGIENKAIQWCYP
jgi:hypothetical protein